jgi:hypothetical protein
MSTRALDVVTIMHALSKLEEELSLQGWSPQNDQQEQFLAWYEQHGDALRDVTGLEALVSRFYEELNKFLTDRRFDPMVEPFDPSRGIGAVSVLDKLVHWLSGPGEIVQIPTAQGEKPGFELPPSDVNVYKVEGYEGSYLLELLTQTDDTLWLFVHGDTSLENLELVNLSMDVMSKPRKTPMSQDPFGNTDYATFAGAQVPMVDFNIKPSLDWLLGFETTGDPYYFVAQAKQQFKMRMDETGARVKVATVIVLEKCIRMEPTVFVVDRPFYGWWTQKGLDLPMAVFFADWDALHQPESSLEDM